MAGATAGQTTGQTGQDRQCSAYFNSVVGSWTEYRPATAMAAFAILKGVPYGIDKSAPVQHADQLRRSRQNWLTWNQRSPDCT